MLKAKQVSLPNKPYLFVFAALHGFCGVALVWVVNFSTRTKELKANVTRLQPFIRVKNRILRGCRNKKYPHLSNSSSLDSVNDVLSDRPVCPLVPVWRVFPIKVTNWTQTMQTLLLYSFFKLHSFYVFGQYFCWRIQQTLFSVASSPPSSIQPIFLATLSNDLQVSSFIISSTVGVKVHAHKREAFNIWLSAAYDVLDARFRMLTYFSIQVFNLASFLKGTSIN